MYRSILVPLDGSPAAEWALPAALNIARRSEATLELVTIEIILPAIGAGAGLSTVDAWQGRARDAQSYLDDIANRIATVYPVPVKKTVKTGTGQGAASLVRYSRDAGVDLIVMTTHGYGPLRRFWLGSVADTVVRRSRIPTLLVRPVHDAVVDLRAEPRFHRVLVPLDGSAAAASILEHALAVGDADRSEYTLLQITPPPDSGASQHSENEAARAQQARAKEYLELIADGLRQRRIRAAAVVLAEWFAGMTILEFAENNRMDLIALTTHGHGGAVRLLLGSVADKVVRGATIPVLLYRPAR